MSLSTSWKLSALLAAVLSGWGIVSPVSAQKDAGLARLRDLPPGWTVVKHITGFNGEIGGQKVRITNTVLAVDKQQLRVNTVDCKTEQEARKVQEALIRIQGGVQARCPREGNQVFELIGTTRMLERAYQELRFKPQRITYDITFTAAPIATCDYMLWNKMYNAFLAPKPNEMVIRQLAKSFKFGDQMHFRTHGLGSDPSSFAFDPQVAGNKPEADGEFTLFSLADLPQKHGVPYVAVKATITAEAFAITPSKRKAGKVLLEATEFWPSADAEIVALARRITADSKDPAAKVAALLAWFSSPENFKFDKRVPGSRFGVKKALQQRYGQCWDFADCFVTLCRAEGIPCRQVLGWLHGLDGHVWAEVLIEGKGWRQVDPQGGAGCDSRYVPFTATENGAMPYAYTSLVRINPRGAKDQNP